MLPDKFQFSKAYEHRRLSRVLPVVGGGDVHIMFHQLSQEALQITAEINGKYHTQVTKDIEPNTIVGGVPAKVIKKIEIKDR